MPTFDELARTLSAASDPLDRIAAAEAIADLDDSRVVPTLARALADSDSRVRTRVEQLLTLFGRRDGTADLAALLNEAERVATSLASEVRRLRGDEEPRQPEIEPMPPPDGYRGDCAILRLTGGPLLADIRRTGRIVSELLGRPLFEVTRELQHTKGFLARRVPHAAASELIERLARSHIVAGAVPEAMVPDHPDPARVRAPRCAPDSLRGNLLPTGQESMAWSDVQLIAAGRIETDLHPDAIDEDWSFFTRPIRSSVSSSPAESVYEYIVEIFGGEPVRRLRLVTHDLDFKTLNRRVSSFATVSRMTRDIVRYADRSRVSAGVWRLADRADDDWEDLTFLSQVGFDAYVAWQR
ncbi:HEAT repeat domain-containing protein, partial [bacterium]|nr:HEAT repeat domain-containing protein [bacterium]